MFFFLYVTGTLTVTLGVFSILSIAFLLSFIGENRPNVICGAGYNIDMSVESAL